MKQSRALWLNLACLLLKRILVVNGVFLLMGFFWRLAFLFYFGDTAEIFNLKADILHSFFLGTRFDSTVIFYINSIPFLAGLVVSFFSINKRTKPLLKKTFTAAEKFLIPYYTIMLSLVTFISAVDFVFYSFYADRINVLIFGFINDDTTALIKTIWRNYPVVWIFIGLGTFFYLLWKGLKNIFTQTKELKLLKIKSLSYPLFVLFFLILFILNGVGARGTLALFPLSEMDTGFSKSIFVNHLCFNGSRALARALELKAQQKSEWDSNLSYFGYGENYRQAFADYFAVPLSNVPSDPLELLKKQTRKNPWAEKNKPHVVLIIMESFGAYWFNYQNPPFDLLGNFKTHLQADTYLTHFLSSTNATIGSLSSLMIGAPQRPISEFLTESEYLQVPFRSSPARIFKNAGYRARFIYGGNPGWREVNKFATAQGFDTVEGEADITTYLGGLPDSHDWGVYDADLFKHLEKSLKEATEPQFILAMTTTNHPPYQLPADYNSPSLQIPAELKNRLIGDIHLAEKRFNTFRYSADQLALFLQQIKDSDLKDKVIVAVTGDHTFWIVNFTEQELLQKGSVPFYIYTPQAIAKKFNKDSFGSQADIPPTLYNLALSEASYYSLGEDLFNNSRGFALNASNLIVDPTGGVLATGKEIEDRAFNWEGPFERLAAGESSSHKKDLAKKYKSLMGVLDYYFMEEKKQQKGVSHHANSSR